MVVDEAIQEEAANCQDPIPRKEVEGLGRSRESRSEGLLPAEQVGDLDWSPCSFPYVAPLTIEARDPIPGDDGVWTRR